MCCGILKSFSIVVTIFVCDKITCISKVLCIAIQCQSLTDAIISIDASTCSLMNDEGNHCCSVLFCGRINCSFHSHQQTATHSFITIHCCLHI